MSDDDSNGKGHLYPRVLLKISGESLMGKQAYGIDPEMVAPSPSRSRTSSISALRCAS